MALTYIQLFEDIEKHLEPYEDDERGRLMMAVFAYAFRGELPDFAGMPERYGWPALKMHVDRCMASYEKQKSNGSRGGRPPKDKTEENPEEAGETQQNPAKPKETQNNQSQSNTQPQPQSQSNAQSQAEAEDTRASAGTAAAQAAHARETVTGLDGVDLSEDIRTNAEVDVLLNRYRLNEAVRGDLLEDIAAHGIEKVKRVLQEAAKSDRKGGLSFNFYRACLASEGKAKPRAAPAQSMQRHEYTTEQYKAMMMDLDAE